MWRLARVVFTSIGKAEHILQDLIVSALYREDGDLLQNIGVCRACVKHDENIGHVVECRSFSTVLGKGEI